MPNTSINPDALLRRSQVAEALTSAGYPVATASLASMVTRGGGPPFRVFGRTALYRWADVVKWAEARTSPPRCSSAEFDVKGTVTSPRHHQQKHKVGFTQTS
jgi:hypothetical protein